jgi:hypothetical protein
MAATVGAGVQDGEMNEALAAKNAFAVGGTSNVSFSTRKRIWQDD